MEIIAHIETDFKTKFGVPRQSGLAKETVGKIIFEPKYRVKEAFRGLECFSHIWILWEFSLTKKDDWSPTVRPPLLGGNERMGVFATRSPFRPNNIGLSAVKLIKIDFEEKFGPIIYVSGADLVNGTPIYDVKPYLPYADSLPDATGGFTDNLSERKLQVNIPDELINKVPEKDKQAIYEILSLDPRPSYIDDPERIYGLDYADFEVKFKVNGKSLTVTEIISKIS